MKKIIIWLQIGKEGRIEKVFKRRQGCKKRNKDGQWNKGRTQGRGNKRILRTEKIRKETKAEGITNKDGHKKEIKAQYERGIKYGKTNHILSQTVSFF